MVGWAVCLYVDAFEVNKLALLILQQNNVWDDAATSMPQFQWLKYQYRTMLFKGQIVSTVLWSSTV
jgi:hypothetical protein